MSPGLLAFFYMTVKLLTPTSPTSAKLFLLVKGILGVLVFIMAIDLLTVSMLQLNNSIANEIFQATLNPYIGLFVGILSTALLQSSSTVTAMTVAVVASGNLSLVQAVPLVMGANIGTTLTSTLVSFSYILKKGEFKKALSAGVLHDAFNILTVMLLLPLEIHFKLLSSSAQYLTQTFFGAVEGGAAVSYPVLFLRPLTLWIVNGIQMPLLTLLLGVTSVFSIIKLLSNLALKGYVSTSFHKVKRHIFRNPYLALLYGIFFTALVQSSTITTSLIVPLVASRKVSLFRAFPFIMGANIGTTITAGIAAFYSTEAAISIAIVHLLFNVIGVLVLLPIPSIRNVPVQMAAYLGSQSVKTRFVGFAYILFTFFVVPFFLIYFNQDSPEEQKNTSLPHTSTSLTNESHAGTGPDPIRPRSE
ncbi:MAG: Na/Pi symporter [Nitritalea sp.]